MKSFPYYFALLLGVLFFCNARAKAQEATPRHTISGFVYERGSRETLIGANIMVEGTRLGTISNNYGFYSISLPAGKHVLVFSYVGYETLSLNLDLHGAMRLDAEMVRAADIEGVEVRAAAADKISQTVQMSRIDLPVLQVRNIPALLGEKDLFKVIQLLPGVQKGNEGSSGFYVRGGGPDQNLVILDDAIVYNASHLFGFFSVFNGDAIKNIQLYKGGFPARYGGRLSSVLDISMKDGSREKFGGEAGVGLIAARMMLEGPLFNSRGSFLVSGRRTYIDALIRPFMPKDQIAGYFFYDLNAKLNYDLDKNNRFYASAYFGKDKFFARYSDSFFGKGEAGLFWKNATTTLRWNHLFNDRLFANTSFIYSDYALQIFLNEKYDGYGYNLSYSSGIRDLGLKYDLSWHPLPGHMIRFGVQSIYHRFRPSAVVLRDDYNQEYEENIEQIDVLESGIYLEDEFSIGPRLSLNPGIRLSHFLHKDRHYLNPEPRFAALYMLGRGISWKMSYASMSQYVHLLSPTGIGLPTDLWVPSTNRVKPQFTWQLATGLAGEPAGNTMELSAEVYYKKSRNTIGYREGASFLLINDPTEAGGFSWEDNITAGEAWSYGLELFLQKKQGRIGGWVGYTLSYTKLKFDDINNGLPFWARYDRRHDVSVVGSWDIRPGVTFSATWVYATGNAMTLPTGDYVWATHNPLGIGGWYDVGFNQSGTPFDLMGWGRVTDYGPTNSFRAGAYHRLDLGMQFSRKTVFFGVPIDRTLELSVYNAYNRKNPFFYFMSYNQNEQRVLKQVSLFPILPSASLHISF